MGSAQLVEWPEPIVRVQALSESGLAAVPASYIRPQAELPSLSTGVDAAAASIPVVDLGAGGAAVAEVAEACREWGFFQVINHGVDPGLVERAVEVWREFFRLPLEAKQAYANSPATYEGYGSRLGVDKGAILDWGDYFFLYLLPEKFKNQEKWPVLPTNHQQSKETVQEYGDELVKLCKRLMKLLSLSLGLDVDRLPAAFGGDDVGATLRANYYPKCPQPELALGLSAHSDPGGITVLLADDAVKGLQIRKGDRWVTVQPLPGAFIVIIGDQIQILTNAVYKSLEHRVVANAEKERLSLALFYSPKSDEVMAPMEELVTAERPAMYPPMTFDEYRLFVRSEGPKGKSQVKSLQKNHTYVRC
ncbi:jasmonate-induced oxygenase 1-like [Curcuma longa]|uniref:jasmonate-induced oxygenase 1-like n=1 Tax=Curcuma longa TaxID=136217 RepID=UPI003D9EEBBA